MKKMRSRDAALDANWGTTCTPLALLAPDGKMRETNCANTEGLFRIIQSIPSPKAEPFKRWLAQMGYERVKEIENPELANAQLAVRRVKLRVALGGHDVPNDVVKRRFGRSLNNFFNLYAPLASRWAVFDNSQSPHARLVATSEDDNLIIEETTTWLKLQKLANRV